MTRRKKPEMMLDNIDVGTSLQSALWQDHFPEYEDHIAACLEQFVLMVPEARNFNRLPGLELSILFSDDDNIRQLNRQYRQMDKATNVLSFPSLSGDDIDCLLIKVRMVPEFPVLLGDIAFAFETIDREARTQGKKFPDHFCHLFLHAMLHLLGYDHIEPGQRGRMETLEKKLLAKLSIDDPYQD